VNPVTSDLSRICAQAVRLSPALRHKQQFAAQFAAYARRLKTRSERWDNEALQALDTLVAACVDEPPRAVPPANPAVGACYLVADPASGPWTGFEHHLAAYTAGGWRLIPPIEGANVLVRSTGVTASFRNGSWQIGVLAAEELLIGGQQVVGPRGAAIASPIGGSIVDVEARTAIAEITARLRDHGLIS
jgi:hypothetical protein